MKLNERRIKEAFYIALSRPVLNKQVRHWTSPCSPREQVLHNWCYLIYKNTERMQISSL